LANATVEVGLFGEEAPLTVLNFMGLCKGYKKKKGVGYGVRR